MYRAVCRGDLKIIKGFGRMMVPDSELPRFVGDVTEYLPRKRKNGKRTLAGKHASLDLKLRDGIDQNFSLSFIELIRPVILTRLPSMSASTGNSRRLRPAGSSC
jgi:hypothetical protein